MTRCMGLTAALVVAMLAGDAGRGGRLAHSSGATGTIRSESIRALAATRPWRVRPRAAWLTAQASLRTLLAPAASAASGQAFDGLGDGFAGPSGTMTVDATTPDPSADVGPTHYVEAVNSQLAIFDKTGVPLLGPVPVNTLWSGFGGDCETNNDGGATVLYDQVADRWVISQFSVTGADGTARPYLACLAVSATPDPAGVYARYAFPLPVMPIAGTFAAWPDGYYATFDRGARAGGSGVCAYDRTQMLAAQPAEQQCFAMPETRVLPADLDGSLLPAPGTPVPLLSLGTDHASLALRTLSVDWTTPANSEVSPAQALAVSPWADPASPSVPQRGGGLLDPGAGTLMRRAAFRASADGQGSLVLNHTVENAANLATAIRWYQISMPGPFVAALPSVMQEGTWAPDADSRWTGGIAMDRVGNIALGYNTSGPSITPEIRYTGRLAADPSGTMTQPEDTIIAGPGAQSAAVTDWGHFSPLVVDPSDDCTFWFTGEFLPANGTKNWRTRVASFELPGCSAVVSNDFTIAANPSGLTAAQHANATTAIETSIVSGSAEAITLSVSGVPAGATASVLPGSVTTGQGAVLWVNAGTAAPGVYSIDVTGTAPSAQHTVAVMVTVTPGPDFSLALSPATRTVAPGGSTTYTVSTAALNGSTQAIALSASGLPAGVTGTFAPASITAGGSSTLTVTALNGAPLATSTFTVTGATATGAHSAAASLTIGFHVPVAVLANAVPITGLAGASGTNKYFVLNVPEGQDALTFTMTGVRSNANLYVRFGNLPTTAAWDCRPFLNGSNETCTVQAPQPGNWYVMIRGVTAYAGVTLKGTYSADTTPALSNGVPVPGISGAAGSQQFWKLTVPAGQATLTFKIAGGTGDADLYVRFGSKPTTTNWTCRPYLNGSTETCTFTNPQAGVWYVMVRGFIAFSGVTLTGTYAVDTTTPLLTNGVPVTNISGATGSQQFWRLAVPAGQTKVTFTMSGGTGDADLYVRPGAKPTVSAWTCRPYLNGNSETCTINNPSAGDYYVMIRGFIAFTGVTLKGSY